MNSFAYQSCKICRERQEDLLESGDGSQVICYCYDGLTEEETEEVFADKVTADVLDEMKEAFLPAVGQLEIDEELLNSTQLKIDENANNSSQLKEDFAESSRCKTDEVSNILKPCTTPKNVENVNKNVLPSAPLKRKVSDSSKLTSSNDEPELKNDFFMNLFLAKKNLVNAQDR